VEQELISLPEHRSLRKYVFVRFVDISGNVEEEFEDTKGR
jgi:hypothetical protein